MYAMQLFDHLGLTIHVEKYVLVPTHAVDSINVPFTLPKGTI